MEFFITFMASFSFITSLYLLHRHSPKGQAGEEVTKLLERELLMSNNADIAMLATRIVEGKKKTPKEFEARLNQIVKLAKESYEKTLRDMEEKK